jgi:hypothetical protein
MELLETPLEQDRLLIYGLISMQCVILDSTKVSTFLLYSLTPNNPLFLDHGGFYFVYNNVFTSIYDTEVSRGSEKGRNISFGGSAAPVHSVSQPSD